MRAGTVFTAGAEAVLRDAWVLVDEGRIADYVRLLPRSRFQKPGPMGSVKSLWATR